MNQEKSIEEIEQIYWALINASIEETIDVSYV